MRGYDQQQGLKVSEIVHEAIDEQTTPNEINGASSKSDKLFEFENDQLENISPGNGILAGSSLGKTNWTPQALPIGQISLEETLEEELTSGVLENNSLTYIKSKANKLESAIREVNRECDNLIEVCDTDKEQPSVQPGDGMLLAPYGNATTATSKKMLVMASIALFATCGGVYAYVNPQNPINLAVHSKIAELANRPVIETVIKPSNNVYASLGDFTPSSRRVSVQATKTENPAAELQKDIATPAAPVSDIAEVKIATAPIVREIIPQARQSSAPQFKASQTSATENIGLSERFGKKQATQPVATVLPETNAAKANNQIQDTGLQLAARPKDGLGLQVSPPAIPSKKRDIEMVKRVVLGANAGATLDNSQVNILVARLAKGDCLSSALHGIFGEAKISPVFVRTLLTDMTDRC